MQNIIQAQEYYNAKQLKMPLDLEIKIPYDSEVRTFDEVLRRVNLSKYLNIPKDKRGRKGYKPSAMLKLVLFCHSIKKRSLREMEEAALNDIRVMWLTNECQPTHQAIKDFIDRYLKDSIENIFIDINNFIISNEWINPNYIFVDGTKIESKANKYKFVWKGSIEKFKAKLYLKITDKLNELNERYASDGLYFPVDETYELATLNKVFSFIAGEVEKVGVNFVYGKGVRKAILQRDYEDLAEYVAKLSGYHEHLRIMGENRKSYAKTDHDATFMRMKDDHMKNNQLKPGYNIQIGVSDEYILHVDVGQERSDYKMMIPFLEGFKRNYGFFPTYPVMDAGYGGLTNYRYLKNNGMALFQKYNMYAKDTKDKKRMNDKYHPHNLVINDDESVETIDGEKLEYIGTDKRGSRRYLTPQSLTTKTKSFSIEGIAYELEAIQNLQSDLGIELRIQRSIQAEGAFAALKEVFNLKRFRRTSTENVKLELILCSIGYNLAKFHKKRQRQIS